MQQAFDLSGPLEGKALACIRGGRVLFEDLSFTLKPGQGLVLLGPNGSGKTSLLRILAGFLEPASGTLSIEDQDELNGMAHYLGHAQGLKPFLTVRENLTFWQRLFDGDGDIEAASSKTGVADFLDFPVRFLSEGQRKRVNLARFLINPLPVWLMDEPAAGLDKDGLELLKTLILEHLKDGGIFIGATHQDLNIAGMQTLGLGDG